MQSICNAFHCPVFVLIIATSYSLPFIFKIKESLDSNSVKGTITISLAFIAVSVLIVEQLSRKEIIESELAAVKQKVHEFLKKFLLSNELNFRSLKDNQSKV